MLSLQAEALSKGYLPEPGTQPVPGVPNGTQPTPDTALSALQNLQPWAGPYQGPQPPLETIC